MKLILNMYDYSVVMHEIMHEKFHYVSSVIEALLAFKCLNFNDLICSQPFLS